MDRKEFLRSGCCALAALGASPILSATSFAAAAEGTACDVNQLRFIQNWLSDLIEAVDKNLDESAKIKLMSECGRGCYRRFPFKQDIAAKGKGDVNKLIEAYKANFEVWREDDYKVHIRYGAVNKNGCYCPAANYREPKPNDIQCYCTRATHEAIWENALGRPVKIDILQTVRHGDPTCHFLVHLT